MRRSRLVAFKKAGYPSDQGLSPSGFTLDALVAFKNNNPSDQGRRWKFVSHAPPTLQAHGLAPPPCSRIGFAGHVLTGKQCRSAIDGRTTRHEGDECIFDYGKQHGTLRKTKHRGIASVTAYFLLNLITYNLVRILKLIAA